MDHFEYRGDSLFCESVALSEIAEKIGTPCYVYSRATIERHWHAFNKTLEDSRHWICYAVKANSNCAVLNILARLGSGFDVVSIGELERVIVSGGDPKKVVFSGVGKQVDEIERALDVGIACFNVESAAELRAIAAVAARQQKRAPVAIRVNPDVDAKTHPYIATGLRDNKFGVHGENVLALFEEAHAHPWLEVVGVDCHIGSQLTELDPILAALDYLVALITQLKERGIAVHHIDMGGGLGVRYKDETPPLPQAYAKAIYERLKAHPELKLILEPGRAIVANAGILLTRVIYKKEHEGKHFAIVDAGMNDLIRPALYSAWHDVIAVEKRQGPMTEYDIVGPVCETGDFIGKNRPLVLEEGDLLAIRTAGAYGFAMSSNYNSRPRPAEVMIDQEAVHIVRERERLSDLYLGEKVLP